MKGAVEAGKIVTVYKGYGQRRVLAVLDVESTDELDQIFMGGLPIAHNLEIAEDVRQGWGGEPEPGTFY